jgi:hypothetical protein
MSKTVTSPWDPADHLKTEDDMVAYFEAARWECNCTPYRQLPRVRDNLSLDRTCLWHAVKVDGAAIA